MWDKVRKRLYEAGEIVELVMAGIVICAIVVAAVTLAPEFLHYWDSRMEAGAFLEFLDRVLDVVIGVEFVKMLCKPNPRNIIEVLIFVISRHMIVQKTTATEDLVAVISICILFFFRRFMDATRKEKNAETEKAGNDTEEQ